MLDFDIFWNAAYLLEEPVAMHLQQSDIMPTPILIYISNYSNFLFKTPEFLCNYSCLQKQKICRETQKRSKVSMIFFLSHGHNPNPEDKKMQSTNRKIKQYNLPCVMGILNPHKQSWDWV